jgi:hypothetical protein
LSDVSAETAFYSWITMQRTSMLQGPGASVAASGPRTRERFHENSGSMQGHRAASDTGAVFALSPAR